MRQYITYRYKFNNDTQLDRSSPSGVFSAMYPEMKGVITITDELLSDEQMKVLPNGEKSAVRIGWVDIDEEVLEMFGHDVSYIQEELKNNQTIKIYLETADTLAALLRNYTTLEEVSDKKFLIIPAYEFMGVKYQDKFLDLNNGLGISQEPSEIISSESPISITIL